ncbi:hypothetical protein [Limnobacter sp.]
MRQAIFWVNQVHFKVQAARQRRLNNKLHRTLHKKLGRLVSYSLS